MQQGTVLCLLKKKKKKKKWLEDLVTANSQGTLISGLRPFWRKEGEEVYALETRASDTPYRIVDTETALRALSRDKDESE